MWCLCCVVGCGAPQSPSTSSASGEGRAAEPDREQLALEERRLQLQHRVLSELNELRESRQASAGSAAPAQHEAAGEEELLLFGGSSHEVFLGCLCNEDRSDSVFNLAGEYGSNWAPASIRNKLGPFGSNRHQTSACNPAATRPPVLVSSSGRSLGSLTLNRKAKRGIRAPSVLDWLGRLCGV
jgi:hypothetical protein